MTLFPREYMTRRALLPALSDPDVERAADAEDVRTRPFASVVTLGETINGRVVGSPRVYVFAAANARDAHVAAALADGWRAWPMDTASALAAYGAAL